MGKYIYEGVKDFDLDHIFDCGQCFRWSRQPDGSYTGIAMGKAVNVSLVEESARLDLVIDNCSEDDFEKIWRGYLDLDRDYGAIKETLSASDEVMAKAICGGEGIRILKQELWEAMVSFIISQNNNIPRIKGCIENLARLFGDPAGEYGGVEY